MRIQGLQRCLHVSASPLRRSQVPLTAQSYPALQRRPDLKALDAHDLQTLRAIVGSDHLLTAEDVVEPFNVDWTRKYRGQSACVLRPGSPAEVSRVLAYCNQKSIAVVPQAGKTGLVGGSVPVFDEVVLSVSRLNAVQRFDEGSGILTCGAGCILETLDNYLLEKGYLMPLDLGSKGTCQIGGNVASNAGGQRLMRYGSLHGTVLSLEVVLANGKILELGKALRKDNTGYHLKHLFIGSEGTLGVITAVSILTPPRPKSIQVALLGLDSFDKVLQVFRQAKSDLGEIVSAFEVFDQKSLEIVMRHHPTARYPLDSPCKFFVLLETAGSNSEHDQEKLEAFLEHATEKELIQDGVLAQDESQALAFWNLRESISDSCGAEACNYKYDIAVPIKSFYPIVDSVKTYLTSRGLYDDSDPENGLVKHVVGFGHMGDGNVHLNIMAKERSSALETMFNDFVFKRTQDCQGSISAEHGIGIQKANYLHYSKCDENISLMRAFKAELDPKGILNPYKYFPLASK